MTFGYIPEKILLKNIYITIDLSYCATIIGWNRCGKYTLIKLVVGDLNSLNGKSTVDPRVKIEYLTQHQIEQLDANSTPLKTMVDRYPGDRSNTHIARYETSVFGKLYKNTKSSQKHTLTLLGALLHTVSILNNT